jgi:hypothetical protein
MFSLGIAKEESNPPTIAVGIRHKIPGSECLGFMFLAYA